MHPLHESLRDTALRDLIVTDNRCTGKSTAIALELLATSIRSPRRLLRIKDHASTPSAEENLVAILNDIVTKLNLKNFHFITLADKWFIAFGVPAHVKSDERQSPGNH